ncbi:alkaline phosphatase family protein [Pelagibacterium sp. H642]|uniref:alkaline phosphatase family protein n=1 Tax=Pelagibacterium sp. H642 TaxID=1881069 RepID=UPI00281618F5|nr:alkaline phosphatase family protein [Pelagibacterium sp. H642]WMT92735.1 alkaline phosphatase family protein [Pelagibacterium sp. H642]
MSRNRFVIIVLDGLRPDLVTENTMPNLFRFRNMGAVLGGSRALYPSHTRVNKTGLGTGTTPKHHGIHFNKIAGGALKPGGILDVAEFSEMAELGEAAELVTATPLGAALADAGRSMAVIHCGASGAAQLLNYGGARRGQHYLSMAGPQFSSERLWASVEAELGAMPAKSGVDLERSRYAVKALTDVVYPQLLPDVTILWSDEPDKSFHVDGLDGPVSAAALAHVDELAGEIIAWWRDLGEDAPNLLFLSDHGHVETSGTIALGALFAEIGLPVTTDPASPGALLLPFGSGGLYLRGTENSVLDDIVRWMQAQPWCGNLLTTGGDGIQGSVPGTFSASLLSLDHERAPDLFFQLRRMDAGAQGRKYGHCLNAGDKGPAGSSHGGLHAEELATVFFAAGPDFKSRYRSEAIGGMVDVAPTILALFGIAQPESMVGRPLGGLLAEGSEPDDAFAPAETVSVGNSGYEQHLTVRRLKRRTLADHGWVG